MWEADRYDISPAITVEGKQWKDMTGVAIWKLLGYKEHIRTWRDSLSTPRCQIMRPFFDIRMEAEENARRQNADIAADEQALAGVQAMAYHYDLGSRITDPQEEMELPFDHGLSYSSSESSDDWPSEPDSDFEADI